MNKVILEKKIKTKPIIGITLDNENPGHYSKFPWYAIRANYLHTIEKLNGIPFPLFQSMNTSSYRRESMMKTWNFKKIFTKTNWWK